MSVEPTSSSGYSPEIVYGQLTSPFIEKMVHINAHPSSEEKTDEAQVISLSDFIPSKASSRVNSSEIAAAGNEKLAEIHEGFLADETTAKAPRLTEFESSKIVKGALKNGYSASEAIIISNAAKSYANASRIGVANMLKTHVHNN